MSHVFSREGAGGVAAQSQHIFKALPLSLLLCRSWMEAAGFTGTYVTCQWRQGVNVVESGTIKIELFYSPQPQTV